MPDGGNQTASPRAGRRMTTPVCLALALLAPVPTMAEEVTLALLTGEWLNREYIDHLEATRSPVKVPFDGNRRWTALYFSRGNRYFEWKQVLSYHEGVFLRITGLQPEPEAGIYRVLFHDRQTHGRATGEDRFLIPHTRPLEEMTWLFDELYGPTPRKRRIAFRRVEPDIAAFVNRTVIAGTYTDRRGRSFTFEENGAGAWPDSTFFTYTVELDKHGAAGRYDVFHVPTDPADYRRRRTYAFEWKDDRLLIFPTREADLTRPFTPGVDPVWIRAESPLFILQAAGSGPARSD